MSSGWAPWRRYTLFAGLLALGLAYIAAFAFFLSHSEDFISRETDSRARIYAASHPLTSDAVLRFAAGSADLALLGRGWHRPDTDGVWSGESEASLFLAPGTRVHLALEFDLVAFVAPRRGPVTVTLAADGEEIGRWRVRHAQPAERARVVLPTTTVVGQPLHVRFQIDAMGVPMRAGINRDRRQLGIKLRELRVIDVPGS